MRCRSSFLCAPGAGPAERAYVIDAVLGDARRERRGRSDSPRSLSRCPNSGATCAARVGRRPRRGALHAPEPAWNTRGRCPSTPSSGRPSTCRRRTATSAIQYRRCGRSGLKLPLISLGLWQNFGDDRPLANSRAILRRAFDLGITHFDLANNYGPPYGSAEINFGRIFAEDLRPYRDELRDLDQGRLRHVARPVRRVGLAQVPAREPRAEPRSGCGSSTSTSSTRTGSTRRRRSRRRWARSTRPSGRARRATSGSRPTGRGGPRRRRGSCASSARRC